jgi:O-antigen/teichoic acid export membrane protein
VAAISTEGSRRASRTAIATFLAPALVVYAVFTFYPVLRTFYNSVHLLKGRNVEEFVGFRNFLDILTQDPVFWKATLIEALPFGISGIFMTIYYSVDSVMLSAIKGNVVVGYYAAANRLIQYLVFVPLVVGTTIYPVMAKYHRSSPEYLVLLCDKCLKYMIMLSIPMAVGTTLVADKIIYSIYGNGFTESIVALQLLIWSMVFVFTSAGYVKLFESINRQRVITKITAVGLVFNVVVNLLLIYALSYIGSSIAAELASCHPRTLRIYEEEGLLSPQRRNNLRLYSEADIQRVRIIRFLTRRQRVNLAGVRVILQLEELGKIRVYDLFDEDDVERFADNPDELELADSSAEGAGPRGNR